MQSNCICSHTAEKHNSGPCTEISCEFEDVLYRCDCLEFRSLKEEISGWKKCASCGKEFSGNQKIFAIVPATMIRTEHPSYNVSIPDAPHICEHCLEGSRVCTVFGYD